MTQKQSMLQQLKREKDEAQRKLMVRPCVQTLTHLRRCVRHRVCVWV